MSICGVKGFKSLCNASEVSSLSSSQAKDTKTVPLAARCFKTEAPAAPFHWMRSKPIESKQTIRHKKSSGKQKTKMAAPVKN